MQSRVSRSSPWDSNPPGPSLATQRGGAPRDARGQRSNAAITDVAARLCAWTLPPVRANSGRCIGAPLDYPTRRRPCVARPWSRRACTYGGGEAPCQGRASTRIPDSARRRTLFDFSSRRDQPAHQVCPLTAHRCVAAMPKPLHLHMGTYLGGRRCPPALSPVWSAF